MTAPEQNIGLLGYKQVKRLSAEKPYSLRKGCIGLFRNTLEVADLRHEAFKLSEAFQVEMAGSSASISALPLTLMIPVIRRVLLGWGLGRARHAYLSNRLNRKAAQQPLATLIGRDTSWVFSSQHNFLVFARSVNSLLADNGISVQIIGLCPKNVARGKRDEQYRRFCSEVAQELDEYARFCAERDSKCQDAYQAFSERVDPLVLQHHLRKNKEGLLTDGPKFGPSETVGLTDEDIQN